MRGRTASYWQFWMWNSKSKVGIQWNLVQIAIIFNANFWIYSLYFSQFAICTSHCIAKIVIIKWKTRLMLLEITIHYWVSNQIESSELLLCTQLSFHENIDYKFLNTLQVLVFVIASLFFTLWTLLFSAWRLHVRVKKPIYSKNWKLKFILRLRESIRIMVCIVAFHLMIEIKLIYLG